MRTTARLLVITWVGIAIFAGLLASPLVVAQERDIQAPDDILAILAEAGYPDVPVQELAAIRSWIPGAFSPHYIAGGATLEIFETASPSAASAALETARATPPPNDRRQDTAVWAAGPLVVILLSASQHGDVRLALEDGLGAADLVTEGTPPEPDPSVVGDGLIAESRLLLHDATGEPVGSFRLERAEPITWNDGCLGTEGICTQALVPGWVLWLRGGDQGYRLHSALTPQGLRLVDGPFPADEIADAPLPPGGSERRIRGSLPPDTPVSSEDEAPAEAADADDGTPGWVWGAIGATIAACLAVGFAYRLWLSQKLARG